MAWHLLEKMIEQSASHSTIFGKWWIAIVFVFRIIVVASIGDTVYSDEQDEFVCNTKQPGCKQVCYNNFAPISHIRFWAFQILATGTPSVIFVIFAMHRLARVPQKPEGEEAQKNSATQTAWRYAVDNERKRKKVDKEKFAIDEKKQDEKHSRSSKNSKLADRDSNESREFIPLPPQYDKVCRELKVMRAKMVVVRSYVAHVIFRTIVEAGCLYAQYHLYHWTVPEFYECVGYPCPKIVECFVSRPMEKTIFLHFMFAVAVLCIAINVFELKWLGWRRVRRCFGAADAAPDEPAPPSAVLGTYPEPTRIRLNGGGRTPTAPALSTRVVYREPEHAPPGYYIPDVDPPAEKYRSPANAFPPIRLRAASFTTSESDVTTDPSDSDVGGSVIRLMEDNVRHL